MQEQLETWHVILIIAGVLGVVWSNIALLKYSTKFDLRNKLDKQIKNKDVEDKDAD
ncbi:hypothetical protein PSECIP111951_01081 [Pseudoalteromonas holothuriae]|uniref:DUF2897 domain-containing protein n=1 Tax=Pseudoalteromonas holothuriae TaxID=2963714 RepID=A0A9W4QX80_9GAMM|nr:MULTISPECIES: DUF2897 family protein [unclassified Pseudoalteromonas]CAH9054648.1 hypothetical protein PSECIP111951_01081 [Pseudoalteromonas sp. CIP111951]CAH9057339.1 hypothetical protein PSECIP111854_01977 [Pseudoalteromonas sp. CIP111854]